MNQYLYYNGMAIIRVGGYTIDESEIQLKAYLSRSGSDRSSHFRLLMISK